MAPRVAKEFTPEARLRLDWRELPSGSDILGRLQKLLTTLDSTGELHMELVRCKAKNIIAQMQISMGQKAVIRFSKMTVKRFSSNKLYFAKLVLVIKYLVQHIGTRQEVKFRQAYYANVLSLTQAQLKKNIQDIALTVGLHPTSLGVESECDGRIYIPESVRITTLIAENLYKVAQAKDAKLASTKDKNLAHKAALRACAKMTLASEQTIPSKVMDIKITKGTVRIVIVVEHRNIGTRLDAIQKELPNAIIIMTQGYSSHATREFLNLLQTLLHATPFVFFSDHDTQGAQIFANFKYGSILSSYAADILCCPRLEWGGPTQKQLLTHLEAAHPDTWSSHQPELLKRMKLSPTRTDHSVIRNLEHMGLLSGEPILRKELDLILAGTGKFHLALLSDGNHGGMERFIVQEANKRTGVVTPANVNVDVRSQLGIRFDNQESQPQTFDYPSTVIDSAKISRIRAAAIPGLSGREPFFVRGF